MATGADRAHEQTINIALGELLEEVGQSWTTRVERVGRIFAEGGRPDILIEKPDGWPIVIEAEVGNYRQAEIEAQDRLGNHLVGSTHTVHAAVALVYPRALREHQGQRLREALRGSPLEYVLYTVGADGQTSRFPINGWLQGSLSELAVLLHRSSIPAWRVEALADSLEAGIARAEGSFTHVHPLGSALGETLASLLGQQDDDQRQTRRMAMAVVVDALIFHEALAEAELAVIDETSGEARSVRSPASFRAGGAFLPSQLVDEWARILGVNYWPIFHTASSILLELPTQTATAILSALWETAEQLVVGGVTRSHDLTGIVFQRLIADRKFLATYYTSPAGAALLTSLCLPVDRPLVGDDWGDATALERVRIGDFACGTGTLLSTAYQRLGLLHEIAGEDPRLLHPRMMERGLVGLDVLTVAVHLTAAMLAGSYPDTPFEGECLLTMPYGSHRWGVCVGSLDLLDEQTSFDIIQAAAHTAGGRGTEEVRDLMGRVGHGQFDLVVMNPPFTRHGAREGDRTQVHNPAFAAFGADEGEQNRLAARLTRLGRGGRGHGHAGLASYFTDLADRKLAAGGTLGLVLPLSSMSGVSWENVRSLWRTEYSEAIICSIAERGTHSRSFSADTGMAEALFVGRKLRPNAVPRATFVILDGQPTSTIEGELIGQAITQTVQTGTVRRLEDGPFGGTRIMLGDTCVGEAVDCPLPTEGPWQMVGIRDITLGQTAYIASMGHLWVEGMPANDRVLIPICRLETTIERTGPHHLDLTGGQIKSDGIPQGPFEHLPGCPPGAAYPSLWNHDTQRERQLVIEPDSHCRMREVGGRTPPTLVARAEARWATATRGHYNLDFQFNSQSITFAMTPTRAIGGTAWPSIVLANEEHEFALALWCNSTLGLMCHWWVSNKTQAGRGRLSVTSVLNLPVLDLNALSAEQHARARIEFEAMIGLRFLPLDQVDEDNARAELDRRLLVNVLGLDEQLVAEGGPIHRLRLKLAGEPQIHGDKQTRVVLTDDGETAVARDPRS
jgi:hypothetical protein